jgi:hypothetical protein
VTRRRLETRQAGTGHALEALKSRETGERRGKHTGRGALGLSIHWRRSTHSGLEDGVAWTGGVARWELPCTHNGQSGVGRGRGLKRTTLFPQRTTPQLLCCCARVSSGPRYPLFYHIPILIPLSANFEVKIWRSCLASHDARQMGPLNRNGSCFEL